MRHLTFRLFILALLVSAFVEPAFGRLDPAFCNGQLEAVGFQRQQSLPLSEQQVLRLTQLNEFATVSTTGLRRESKMVVNESDFQRVFGEFSQYFGQRLKLRDVPEDGTNNLTDTLYTTPLWFNSPTAQRSLRSVKVRVRGYLSERQQSGEIIRSSITAKKRFLELKVDHPEFDGVVIKHRLLVTDEDLRVIFNPKATYASIQKVVDQVGQDPVNATMASSNLIDAFIAFVRAAPVVHSNFKHKYVVIRYRRDAYQVRLMSKTNEPIDIQITVDDRVNLHDAKSGKNLAQYPEGARVIEVKVPLKYSQFTPENLSEVPELAVVQRLIETLDAAILPGFTSNTGKLSNTIRLAI